MSYKRISPQPVVEGGTGAQTLTGVLTGNGTSAITANTVTQYHVLTAGASNAVSEVASLGTTGQALLSNGAGSNPSFGTVPVSGGGTGATTLTGILTGNGTSPVTANAVTQYAVLVGGASNAASNVSGLGTSGQVLTSNGAGFNPSWQDPTSLYLQYTKATLTSAQVKSLHGTPVQVLAAPGANKLLIPCMCIGRMVYGGTNPFIASASQRIQLIFGNTPGTSVWDPILSNALNLSSNVTTWGGIGAGAGLLGFSNKLDSEVVNKAFYAYNPISTEISGNAANDNIVEIYIYYFTYDFS